MAFHSLSSDDPVFAFTATARSRLTAEPGDTICFHTTDDAYVNLTGDDIDLGAAEFHKANRLCGPVHVSGARPGDALGVEIESITPGDRAFAVYVARWRKQLFGIDQSHVVPVQVRDGAARLSNRGLIAARPMIGCIGVAPASGMVSSLSPTARTGGNMDLVELVPGATIWLPVEVEGALLSLGDLHVRMGRGEPLGSGLECGGEVVARVRLAKDREIAGPIVVDSSKLSFVGTGEHDAEAIERAARAAWNWLTKDGVLDQDTALLICAALLELDFGGPAGSNVVASFEIAALSDAGVDLNRWPLIVSAETY